MQCVRLQYPNVASLLAAVEDNLSALFDAAAAIVSFDPVHTP